MGFGIEFGMVAVSALFWSLGWMIDNFKWTPNFVKPYLPAFIAGMGALTLSTTWIAGMLSGALTWFTGVIPGGQIVLVCLCVWLLGCIVVGLADGKLDKRDVMALVALPILTLSIGGPFGETADQLRHSAQDATMSVVSSIGGV